MGRTQTLRILMVEDVPADAELIGDELRSSGIDFVSARVHEREKLIGALKTFAPDVILSDYRLPAFDGEEAFLIVQKLVPDLPFIFVTGALGEDRAVELMKKGATDFVLKDRLSRLPLCVKRALQEAAERRQRKEAEKELEKHRHHLEELVKERTGQLEAANARLQAEITERKRAEDAVRKANDELERRVEARTVELRKTNEELMIRTTMLERSNRDLDEFAHVASHDLQEPLRKIQTFSDRLVTAHRDSLDDKARDYLDRMKRAAGRMQLLVRELLGYARVAARPADFARFNLKDPVEEAVAELGIFLRETQGRIQVGTLPDIEADRAQMRQLFQNLIENGLKFHGERKPVVRVNSRPSSQEPFWEIHVEDNGIGFDECYLDKIFQPFQRLHGKNPAYPGTGMGLAVCRRIVERHGGSITAKSQPGRGATFIVKLPGKARG